jgi:HlyD family secretion protein
VVKIGDAPIPVNPGVGYEVWVDVSDKESKFKPGMTAIAEIIIAQKDSVLEIGNAALRFHLPGEPPPAPPDASRGEPALIYVLREGSANPVPRRIKTGITNGIFTEVTEGLNEGDRVVVGMDNAAPQTNPP